ncbi:MULTISPECIES: hypothetical protein [Streptomyces]|uniref:hypothetical protein n=1 Tax=Streptomyces TaxID=1883 RepID=UPI0016795BEF|nr:hypothetical protein [Streptomyces noursei]MCZ1020329.1 hypothetical protein [Streptomyces noursei]GGX55168.1 hypothetical protein GCM10010341_90130 [Streptomyces noursei]
MSEQASTTVTEHTGKVKLPLELLTQRPLKHLTSWTDVGEGTVGPNEWPFYAVTLTLDQKYLDANYSVVAHLQGIKWGRAAVRDAWAADAATVTVQVGLNPEFFDKSMDRFVEFDIQVSTFGPVIPTIDGGAS